ncbi:MAG: pilus assembly FimT family protein [Verrucomicrobiales bacterium]
MRRGVQRARWRRAFSLLEIIIVLSVAVVIAGSAVLLMGGPEAEEALRNEHAKVGDFARQARSLAVAHQVPFVVTLRRGEVTLAPLNWSEGDEAEGLRGESWPRVNGFSGEFALEVTRWGALEASLLEGDRQERWIFEPNGLCEPVRVRFFKNGGAVSLTRVFHPLTGLAEDVEKTITVEES